MNCPLPHRYLGKVLHFFNQTEYLKTCMSAMVTETCTLHLTSITSFNSHHSPARKKLDEAHLTDEQIMSQRSLVPAESHRAGQR